MDWQEFRASLFDGIYHELGHIIAEIVYFPDTSTIEGMALVRQPNGAYKFNTIKSYHPWQHPKHMQACAMICMCGGIFQQIKNIDITHVNYNWAERFVSYFSKKRALISYLQRVVQPEIVGMEVDIEICNDWLAKVGRKINFNKVKNDAILLLLPYANKKSIDELSNIIADKIVCV